MTQRIAPNNSLPATHFIEVWKASANSPTRYFLERIKDSPIYLASNTIAIFRIRENKLPTLHNFNK